jgi:hypothetical protein
MNSLNTRKNPKPLTDFKPMAVKNNRFNINDFNFSFREALKIAVTKS